MHACPHGGALDILQSETLLKLAIKQLYRVPWEPRHRSIFVLHCTVALRSLLQQFTHGLHNFNPSCDLSNELSALSWLPLLLNLDCTFSLQLQGPSMYNAHRFCHGADQVTLLKWDGPNLLLSYPIFHESYAVRFASHAMWGLRCFSAPRYLGEFCCPLLFNKLR